MFLQVAENYVTMHTDPAQYGLNASNDLCV